MTIVDQTYSSYEVGMCPKLSVDIFLGGRKSDYDVLIVASGRTIYNNSSHKLLFYLPVTIPYSGFCTHRHK